MTNRHGSARARRLLVVLALAVVSVGCTPGASAPIVTVPPAPATTGVPDTGPITLTVWDQECCQVSKVWDQLNSEFETTYPNVTIARVNRDFGELKSLLRLAMTGPNGPDVVEANQGWPDMGQFVRSGLLLPLDNYVQAYGWNDEVSSSVMSISRWSPDGKQFGTGNLYGFTTMGEIIGVYYNKQKLQELGLQVPTTFDEFQQDLQAAKDAGEIPIQFGNNDAFPGIHEYAVIQDQLANKQALTDFIFGTQGTDATFDTPENVQAAQILQDWANKGFLTPGFGGSGYQTVVNDFASENGVFMITGNWIVGDLGADNPNFGFFLMPPMSQGAPPASTGGAGFPLAIAAGSDHPDAAAAYIDWMTSAHAAELLLQTGQLPLRKGETGSVQPGTVLADVVDAARQVSQADGVVPYEDWATPTFYDTMTAAIQELMVNRLTPEAFTAKVQVDYQAFQSSRT
jgi:raffinose/stachyose/melibiose transport system substrate-binding protein